VNLKVLNFRAIPAAGVVDVAVLVAAVEAAVVLDEAEAIVTAECVVVTDVVVVGVEELQLIKVIDVANIRTQGIRILFILVS
jgi:hypothetical protein